MRPIDWALVVIGLSGVVMCLRSFSGADAISIIVLAIAFLFAILALVTGLKALVDGAKSKSRPTPPTP